MTAAREIRRPRPVAARGARAAYAQGDVDAIMDAVRDALMAGDQEKVAAVLTALHLADRADIVEAFELEVQGRLLADLPDEEAADILEEMDDEEAATVAASIDPEQLAPIIDAMEADEAADVLGDLAPDRAEDVLHAMDDSAEAEVRPLLAYPDESAGGRMTTDYVALRADDSVAQAIEHLRQQHPDSEWAYYVYAVDAEHRLAGVVSLRELITADPSSRIEAVMYRDVIQVRTDDDQETAARLMARYDLLALPVVDSDLRLVGVITHDDLVDVLEEEATEDMYLLVGLDEAERTVDPVALSVRRRLPWLVFYLIAQLVLVTALKFFEATLDRVAALAVLFPLVTGQGGNVGAQTTTIIIRSLALGQLERQRFKLLARQVSIGLVSGLVVGLLAGIVALVVTGESALATVIAGAMVAAMTINLAAGGLVGTLVPLSLKRLGYDPAVASSAIVTALTDTAGVILFLGLFTLLTR